MGKHGQTDKQSRCGPDCPQVGHLKHPLWQRSKMSKRKPFSNNIRAFKRLNARVVSPVESRLSCASCSVAAFLFSTSPTQNRHQQTQTIPVKIASSLWLKYIHHDRICYVCGSNMLHASLSDIGRRVGQLSHLKRDHCVAGRLCSHAQRYM